MVLHLREAEYCGVERKTDDEATGRAAPRPGLDAITGDGPLTLPVLLKYALT